MKKENNSKIKNGIDKKKLIQGIGIIAVVLAVLGLSFFASNSYGTGTSSFEFTNITVDEYLNLMASEEKSIIYVAKPDCSYCQMETPILKKIASKYDLKVHYLNTSGFVDYEAKKYTEDGEKFMNSAEVYKTGFGTPNTIIVQNGEIIDGVYQYVDAKELEDLFERSGFINE